MAQQQIAPKHQGGVDKFFDRVKNAFVDGWKTEKAASE